MILSWQKTEELLEKYQIPLVESLVIENAEQGIEFANRVGYPVVLKLLSSDDLHKTDKGLVKLNLQNEQQLNSACKELGSLQKQGTEFLAQKQVRGVELFMGMKWDKNFGPVVSFGLGGIFVEVLNNVVLGVCPINKKEALEMIESIKGYKILQGYRGQPKIDVEKLADILVSVSKLAIENENIREIDFNPVFADGNNIMVADAKII
ncbi:MAG: acetate--CoA ligase family protein [Candidatus Gribaldobacteria bacterium]|nr:acetate--CoA ligase family protein [Candidatus Gribaldobacteria bacterium]